VALVGEGEGARTWRDALRPLADVVPLPETLGGIEALVLAPGAHDPFARASDALLADLPVLYAAPFALSPWHTARLSELSRARRLLLRFVEPFRYRQGFPFLRRLLQGQEPFWRPRYLRLLCLEEPDAGLRIDELATEQLAVCDALLNDEPRHASAAAVRCDDTGDVCAAFLTLQYGSGTTVQCTISLVEATHGRQLVAVAPERTIILDDLDPVASVRIVGGAEHEPGEALDERSHRLLASSGVDPVEEEARAFVEAVRSGDRRSANGDRWSRVAGLWWAARRSMTVDGPVEVPAPSTEPPPLKVIEGGGKTVRRAHGRPSLTVVN